MSGIRLDPIGKLGRFCISQNGGCESPRLRGWVSAPPWGGELPSRVANFTTVGGENSMRQQLVWYKLNLG